MNLFLVPHQCHCHTTKQYLCDKCSIDILQESVSSNFHYTPMNIKCTCNIIILFRIESVSKYYNKNRNSLIRCIYLIFNKYSGAPKNTFMLLKYLGLGKVYSSIEAAVLDFSDRLSVEDSSIRLY